MNLAKNILDKIVEKGGYSQLELSTNIGLNNFIELLINEQKVSYLSEETKSVIQNNEINYLDIIDIKPILKTILSSSEFKSVPQNLMIELTSSVKPITGLGINLYKSINDDGVLEFEAFFPELPYIRNNFFDSEEYLRKDIFNKILYPYWKKTNNLTSHVEKTANIEKAIMQLTKMIKTNSPTNMNPESVAEYFLQSIVNLENLCSEKIALMPKSKFNIFEKFRQKKWEKLGLENLIKSRTKTNLSIAFEKWEKIKYDLEVLSNGVSAQIFINSQELQGKTPEQIQEILKKSYKMYTKHEQDPSFKVSKTGYRTRNVRTGSRKKFYDVFLHRENGKIEKAMDNLSKNIVDLVGKSEKMSKEEYIKEVAKIHFRYISIHPFRDSNGRTGRNLINLLLNQKDMMFILPKNDKNKYINMMNQCRNLINLPQYLKALVEYPEKLDSLEKPISEKLGDFIQENSFHYMSDAVKSMQDKNLNRWIAKSKTDNKENNEISDTEVFRN